MLRELDSFNLKWNDFLIDYSKNITKENDDPIA
jgi:hypothetical protein